MISGQRCVGAQEGLAAPTASWEVIRRGEEAHAGEGREENGRQHQKMGQGVIPQSTPYAARPPAGCSLDVQKTHRPGTRGTTRTEAKAKGRPPPEAMSSPRGAELALARLRGPVC